MSVKKDEEILDENPENTDNKNPENNNLVKSSPLKKVIAILTCFLVGLEIMLNYVFNISLDTKIIVEVVSIILSSLVFLGVVKTNKKDEDILTTKNEIEKTITEKIDKLKKK